MAHELTTADASRLVLRKQKAWHGLGNVIPDDLSAVEAGEQFGLFDPITGWGLAAHNKAAIAALGSLKTSLELNDMDAAKDFFARYERNRLDVDTHKANVMVTSKDGLDPVSTLLGIVGTNYQVCQNRELAEFTDALAQTGKVVIETAGTLKGGKKVWFLARGEEFDVANGDKVFPYLLVSNAHDGSNAIRVTPSTTRVVCSNTFHLVVPRNDGGSLRCDSSAISLRHSGDLAGKLGEARNAIKHYSRVLETNRTLFGKLQEREVSRDKALEYFAGQYTGFGWAVPTNEELNSDDAKVQSLAKRRQVKMDKAAQDFLKRWDAEKEIAGGENAWLAFNSMSGVIQHDIKSTGKDDAARVENRIKSTLFGINADRTQQVFESALAV